MCVKRTLSVAIITAAMCVAACIVSACRENKIHDEGNYATATTTVTPPASKRK